MKKIDEKIEKLLKNREKGSASEKMITSCFARYVLLLGGVAAGIYDRHSIWGGVSYGGVWGGAKFALSFLWRGSGNW